MILKAVRKEPAIFNILAVRTGSEVTIHTFFRDTIKVEDVSENFIDTQVESMNPVQVNNRADFSSLNGPLFPDIFCIRNKSKVLFREIEKIKKVTVLKTIYFF